jgi:UDP-2-acetamido-3-amino-2,3-dideoxy-glucuronate N-acetyltransferase
MNNLYSLIQLTATNLQTRGNLSSLEFNGLPFSPKRLFFVSNVPINEVRGKHAHHICLQILFCVKGSFKCRLTDGVTESFIQLEENGPGVLIPALTWGELSEFDDEAVMLCLASEEYDATDYIYSIEELRQVRQNV